MKFQLDLKMVRTAKTKLTVFTLIQSCACDLFYKNGKCFGTFCFSTEKLVLVHSVLVDKLLPNLRQVFGKKMRYNIKLQLSQHFLFAITLFHSSNRTHI